MKQVGCSMLERGREEGKEREEGEKGDIIMSLREGIF